MKREERMDNTVERGEGRSISISAGEGAAIGNGHLLLHGLKTWQGREGRRLVRSAKSGQQNLLQGIPKFNGCLDAYS